MRKGEVRCACGKCLGSWDGETLVIRRLGLVLRGGFHSWTCQNCGVTQEVDLRSVMAPV